MADFLSGEEQQAEQQEERSLKAQIEDQEYYTASQKELVWQRFKKHRLALFGASIVFLFYFTAIFAEFIIPYRIFERDRQYVHAPPQRVRFIDDQGQFHLRPFVYPLSTERDSRTFELVFTEDKSEKNFLYFFVETEESYSLMRFFEVNTKLFGSENGRIFLFGTDSLGRDLFSRTVYASRISVSIGLIGVFVSFILGCIFGGISGYFGGKIDVLIQRVIEFLISIPRIPLWMALSASIPQDWGPLQVYMAITIILSLVGWGGLARVVRGKLLELREEDYVTAAKIAGARESTIIVSHLLPGFMSYLIVNLTLAIPGMILGETALSFLGLGLRPPVVSWGTLLQASQNFRTVARYPWLMFPGIFVVTFVLCINFMGDGLRDAADPYK